MNQSLGDLGGLRSIKVRKPKRTRTSLFFPTGEVQTTICWCRMVLNTDGKVSQSTHDRFDHHDRQSLVRGSAWSCFAPTQRNARPEDGRQPAHRHPSPVVSTHAPGEKRSGDRDAVAMC